jgi:hypothetical protein|tara:strand:- start:323 stop:598 length:276 start_codon:yes stop_codon:yes gene_type:complete
MVKKIKCIQCNKTLRRVTQQVRNQKEPYKGNLICYMKKKEIVKGWAMPSMGIKVGDTVYSYRLWDGESYHLLCGKHFCGRACAANWALARN